MNSEKKVSIVLPTYNGERYLAQSIESVLTQTYENLELIIVDDCSTDGTPEIVRRFAERDGRVQVIRNAENQKLPRSLNIGFRQAAGDLLTWTSDDNFYEGNAIEVMARALDQNPDCGMVYCDMTCIYEDGVELRRPFMDMEQFYVDDVVGACFLYRRQVLETVGEYNPDLALVEDYDYWLRIRRQYEVLYIPQRLYQDRFHSGSLTMTKERKVAAQLQRMRLRHLDFLLDKVSESEKEVLFLDMWLHSSRDMWQLRCRFFPGGVLPKRLTWLYRVVERGNQFDPEKELILFGAGNNGHKALRYFGKERVRCFVDNDERRTGTSIDGVPIVSFDQMVGLHGSCQLVLCVGCRPMMEIAAQLEASGITEYALFMEAWLKG